LQRFAHTDLFRILGKEVHSPSGQAMGRIVDLLVDEMGRPQAAIIDFGGFLGVGIRRSPSTGIPCGLIRTERSTQSWPISTATP
jgi:hypothetical protein